MNLFETSKYSFFLFNNFVVDTEPILQFEVSKLRNHDYLTFVLHIRIFLKNVLEIFFFCYNFRRDFQLNLVN